MCVVEKRNGVLSFPKGSLQLDETVKPGAMREWWEEVGVSTERLVFLQGAFFDEGKWGCRFLLALVRDAEDEVGEPDNGCTSWIAPYEDTSDPDPIARAHWVPVETVLRGEIPGDCWRPLDDR